MLNSRTFLSAVLFAVVGTIYAQTSTSSPYSISGMGELKSGGFVQHRSLGGATRAILDPNSFSVINPASYAFLDFTVFDAGMDLGTATLRTANQEGEAVYGNFNHFAMAFPFETRKKMAMSFGTYQFSDVGYHIKNTVSTDTPSYYNLYKGNGGINRLYLGYGIEAVKNLRLGVNTNINFGSIQSVKAKVYPNTDDVFSFSDERLMAYSGLDFDFGVQYTVQDSVRRYVRLDDSLKTKVRRTSIISHNFAATYHTAADLQGSGYRYAETFFGTPFSRGELVPIDTLLYIDDLEETMTKPAGFGVSYSVSNGIKWQFVVDYEKYFWSEIINPLSNSNFFDNQRLGLGFSFIPKPDYSVGGKYFSKVRYNVGFRQQQMYYNFFDQQISEFGISFGLGLPVTKVVRIEDKKTAIVSRVYITGEYIKRGRTENSLIQEDYYNLGVGLNFNDKWFTKRKYR